jgi:hypothetical protein
MLPHPFLISHTLVEHQVLWPQPGGEGPRHAVSQVYKQFVGRYEENEGLHFGREEGRESTGLISCNRPTPQLESRPADGSISWGGVGP